MPREMRHVRPRERTFHLNGQTEGCGIMKEKPSEWCDDCFWWREDPSLCAGCPNNTKTQERTKSHLDEILGMLRRGVTLRHN
jgi:hypothetical protein